jgi:AcrR family transcriptional regulator
MSERSLMHAPADTRSSLRRRIVEAADLVIRERGLGGATTREIARAAGCAEGSIYVHFADKTDLVIAVITEREPHFATLLELPARAGEATMEENLARWLEELLELFRDNLPIFFALMSDRAVFARFAERLAERRTGPLAVAGAAAEYLAAEQRLGRVDERIHLAVAAATLVGAARDHAFTSSFAEDATPPAAVFAREAARLVVAGLEPKQTTTVGGTP